jgi:hypothetical protein
VAIVLSLYGVYTCGVKELCFGQAARFEGVGEGGGEDEEVVEGAVRSVSARPRAD